MLQTSAWRGLLLSLLLLSGCATGPDVPPGCLFTSVRGPNTVGPNAHGAKKGEACASNILSIAAFGDNSIAAAKRATGITKVAVVDYDFFSILGIYTKVCTIVAGE